MTVTPKVIHRCGSNFCPDTLYVCPNGDIAIYHGSLTVTLPLTKWHELGKAHIEQQNIKPTFWGWIKHLLGG